MSKKCINYLVLTERELIFLLKSDDIHAFEQLYHNYKVRLYRNVLRIIKTEQQTEDLLKEVFVRIWANREDIDPAKPFRVHLFKVTESLIYDFFRKAALNRKIESHFISVATATGNSERKEDVYTLRETDDRIYHQAAHLPGTSISGINGHIIKASQTVRRFFRITN